MKKSVFLILIFLFNCGLAGANVSLIKNGSFEYDGDISLPSKNPQYWCDVNIPAGKFSAWVFNDWSFDFDYSLTLKSEYAAFEPNEMVSVSQQVYLNGVSKIYFELLLRDDFGMGWYYSDRSAVVLIDGNEIWNSDSLPASDTEEYFVEVNDIAFGDSEFHTLTLGLKSTAYDSDYLTSYYAQWDAVRFDTYCEGFGYSAEDFNFDCVVDACDFAVLAENWLLEEPNGLADVYADGAVDMYDFAVIADKWRQFGSGDSNTLMAGDLNDDGIIDMFDFALLGRDWRLAGSCLRTDTNNDKTVNTKDLAEVSNMWLETNWLHKVTN